MLDKEYKYYLSNQKALLKEYKGKVLVIKDEKITGVYDSEAEAYQDSILKYELGTFLIQKCVPEDETIQTFHSNVIFS
jgi:hypothetical protein